MTMSPCFVLFFFSLLREVQYEKKEINGHSMRNMMGIPRIKWQGRWVGNVHIV